MATASFSSGQEDGDERIIETFDPMVRAAGRLQTVVFEQTSIAITDEQANEILRDILPYVDCHLSLCNAEAAAAEIGRRTGVIPNEEE